MKLWRSTASSSLYLRRRLLTVNRSHFLRSQVAWFSEYKEAFVYDPSRIRNFSIIAHVDHGKSTLADRLLQTTGTIPESEMQNQVLDNMELERERGITIKLQAARMNYKANNGENYLLNLIDTPGHVDFGYEVSRSLAACEGALLVVDASQGVEAQTMANVYLALENNLEIVPVINKIDLPTANADRVRNEMEGTIGMDCSEAIPASAKHGIGVDKILEAIVHKIPPPAGDPKAHLQALIFDSYYDTYRGVIVFFRVVNGSVKKLDKIKFKNSGKEFEVMEVGIMTPKKYEVDILRAGEVGYLAANVKSVHDARVGDTFTHAEYAEQVDPLPGYEPAKQMVYAGVYPSDSAEYETLRDAINKLKLNDAALSFAPEVSVAMGTGFRCGFLGLLHMDIVQERLEREYNLNLIVTAPSVRYKIVGYDGTETYIESPAELPDTNSYKAILEPYVKLEIISPSEHIGAIMDLASDRRGEYVEMKYLTSARVNFIFEIPLAEVITDFFDDLKSLSKGYASMSFHDCGYRENDLVKLKILINNEDAPPLATIIHRDKAYHRGRAVCLKLKELIPRQLFKVPIQAAVGTKVIAAEHITPVRKDVLAKCYGGDVTRKKKLLAKQAEGKKRMKMIGRVNVPQEAFLSVIKAGRGENEE